MSSALVEATSKSKAPLAQNVKEPGIKKNNAGGYVFKVSDESRLERFFILGTDGGTYYVGEKKLTEDSIKFLRKMLKKNERLVLDLARTISDEGRAYSNSPAIFAVCLALAEGTDKVYAREAFAAVVRTSTHLFEAAQYTINLGGWGRAKRKAFEDWYNSKTPDELAYQVVKYRSRTV